MIAYNGEVYNFLQLREQLEAKAHAFRGDSDTEVLLASITEWGVQGALERLNGMFAFALWDVRERVLYLARDRIGEKPLYYGWVGNTFLFASELKPIRSHPGFNGSIDRRALTMYLRYQYVPTPLSIYTEIKKLPPGTFLRVRLDRRAAPLEPEMYWSAREAVERAQRNPFAGSIEDATEQLEDLLSEAVKLRMMSDVPIGAFLSGGVDSSTVVALMQNHTRNPVKTFSVGFHDEEYDEAPHARRVARHLGCDHTELYVTPVEARDVIPLLPEIYDEPFSDSSQIPTWLVSRLAREHVVVSLTGDAGDELFGGYGRYPRARDTWTRIDRIPRSIRVLGGGVARLGMTSAGRRLVRFLKPVVGRRAEWLGGEQLAAAAHLSELRSADDLYRLAMSTWSDPASVVIGGHEAWDVHSDLSVLPRGQDGVERMMFLDLVGYLADGILAKVDRAAMSVSLETRIPLLDPRVIEFAWSLPLRLKVQGSRGKLPLRRVLGRHVPVELTDRPKMGFGVPIGSWLRGPLQAWAESLLNEPRLRSEGYLRPEPIRRCWHEHIAGRADWKYQLWTILMFQAWLDKEAL